MQANWSLVLNVLLLIGVVITIGRMMKARRQNLNMANYEPSIGKSDITMNDDIIAVRKINSKLVADEPALQPAIDPTARASYQPTMSPVLKTVSAVQVEKIPSLGAEPCPSVVMFLLAKENRQLAGYELLQTLLAVGLRFGEGHLFHRHQSPNGQGPVLCSLAAATSSGVFDLQNIGAFSVRGLCLFMQASGNSTIDAERFSIMLDTAKQLSEGLDAYLLDAERQPLSDESIQRYYRLLKLGDPCEQTASA